ncbi:divalent-cation tolerance protein CutA [Noviherbaspirillum galbum]|uniref:Divalent-cation tolerance protein CutA n=1 Tax=Noviherbaspirillum galbum TaxID=2709383 RepID=A0A6B3SKW6_9BURK|nr:divalent-cation tolerance protein CutA [Noviherbaspirillum galbum]NEX61484.1 divalent-cation tolerance protein CutA [Noviherbaspirillum galbum]
MEHQILAVVTNVPDQATAQRIARHLVEQKLAACVNILPAVHSLYRWDGELEEATEIPLLIKTSAARYDELQAAIQALHPYEVPELIAMPVTAGLPAYLGWVVQETAKESHV